PFELVPIGVIIDPLFPRHNLANRKQIFRAIVSRSRSARRVDVHKSYDIHIIRRELPPVIFDTVPSLAIKELEHSVTEYAAHIGRQPPRVDLKKEMHGTTTMAAGWPGFAPAQPRKTTVFRGRCAIFSLLGQREPRWPPQPSKILPIHEPGQSGFVLGSHLV